MHVLDPAGMLIHHAIHALNDPLSSPLLRNLFETALLASRLTDGDATALRERCERWKIAAPVARALWLAHDLFGTPAVFGRPPRTYYEFWFPLCLEQTAARTTREKIIREIARRHLEMLGVGRDPRSAFQLAGAAAETIWCPLSTRLRRHDGPLHRITGCHVGLDGALLLYAQPTSEVHLLNPAAARVFLAADGKKTAAEIERAVAANGGPARRDTRTALRALFASGLLRG